VKALIIKAAAANTNDVVVTSAAANGFITWTKAAGDGVNVKPGGILVLVAPNAAGYGVTAGTGDLLNIANSGAGTGVTYDIIVIGTSA
jgi:phosphoserine phosphatase